MFSTAITKKTLAFMTLCKWRVNSMIVFTALIGMVLASPHDRMWQSWRLELIAWAILGIAFVAASAAAINHVIERTVDALMPRTDWRPLPKGLLSRSEALVFSSVLAILGLSILYKQVNPFTMWLTFATFIGYALIYTAILKPATPQNIVIGGVAGSMPPVLGWAAMTEEFSEPAFALFLIIFLWTPPHFWALACYRREDYRKSGLPMMPITHGIAFTCLQSLLYTLLLSAATLLPYLLKFSGFLYLIVALLLNVVFITYSFRLWRNYTNTLARHTFKFSIVYLFVLFAALLLDHFMRF